MQDDKTRTIVDVALGCYRYGHAIWVEDDEGKEYILDVDIYRSLIGKRIIATRMARKYEHIELVPFFRQKSTFE
jgi:hypothetical protein